MFVHPYTQTHLHTRALVCTCVSGDVWQGQKQGLSPCNSVHGGTNTHLYDNFLFTSAEDSNTDTIHFPFINWCRNVVFRGSDFWSLLGLKGDGVCFPGGRSEPSVPERWSGACEAWALGSVAFAWESGSKLVSSDNMFAVSGIITSTGHLAAPAANSLCHSLLSRTLFYFHRWHPESTLGNRAEAEIATTLWL